MRMAEENNCWCYMGSIEQPIISSERMWADDDNVIQSTDLVEIKDDRLFGQVCYKRNV